MKKIFFLSISILFFSCTNEENISSSNNNSMSSFERIDKKSDELFTKQERKNAYQKSVSDKSSVKKSLNNNRNYNGYGSLKSKKKSKTKNKYSQNKKIKTQRPKSNNVGYSAYATN
tara:strand:+ start:110 stop:457 length:348 start_codon:yes stop_codon:yes gene_type:complete